jgi:2,3-bisphosphoglycerate-independent phosphoglycerate mutase
VTTVLVILDGLADEPAPALGGRTPLQAAATPRMERLAAAGVTGRFAPIPPGTRAGSEVGVPSCLGLEPDPHVGRAALEALGRGIDLPPGTTPVRATAVHLSGPFGAPGTVLRAVADPRDTHAAIAALGPAPVDGVRLFADPEGRHLCRIDGPPGPETAPPHDLVGLPLALGGTPARVDLWADLARRLPGDLALWPWGGPVPGLATAPAAPSPFGAVVTAVDVVRGIARRHGLATPAVPGATGRPDTDLAAKARAALSALARHPRVAIHVEATDMAAHALEPDAKTELLARVDRELMGALAEGPDDLRVIVTGDHGTSSVTGRHLDGPVPFVAGPASALRRGPGRTWHEAAVARAPVLDRAAWRGLLLGAAVPCWVCRC